MGHDPNGRRDEGPSGEGLKDGEGTKMDCEPLETRCSKTFDENSPDITHWTCAKAGDHECIKNGCLTIGSKTTCYCDTDYCNGSPQVIRKESLTLTSISVIFI